MGISCIYVGFVLLRGFEEVIQVGPTGWVITDYLIQGHMILMVGDMAFLMGYWVIKNSAQSNVARNFRFDGKFYLSFSMGALLLLLTFIDMQFSLTENRLFLYFLTY
mgnify:FL=1